MTIKRDIAPVHPGTILKEDFLPDYDLSARKLADLLGEKNPQRVHRVLKATSPLNAELALKVARLFGTSVDMWINMQASYDKQMALLKHEKEIESVQPITNVAA